jgi:hypothetical protein
MFPPVGKRPNPEGWKGGSENYTTVWQSHGHRIDSVGVYFDTDDDPEFEMGELDTHEPDQLC